MRPAPTSSSSTAWPRCTSSAAAATLQILPAADDPEIARAAARALAALVADGRIRELVITKVDGVPVGESPFRDRLLGAGFVAGYRGARPSARPLTAARRCPRATRSTGPRPACAPYLVGRTVTAARVRARAGPQVERVVGATIEAVEANGKNLLIRFDNGLEIRTHLRMNGSWHRYRPGERWRRPPARARLVLEVPGAVAVCFDAPVVELFERRAEAIHPTLARLGPDLLAADLGPTADEAHRRLRDPARAAMTISAALLDQRALAGIGNIWRNETLFAERVDPWAPVADVDDETLDRLIARPAACSGRSVATRPGGPRWGSTAGRASVPALRHARPVGPAGRGDRRGRRTGARPARRTEGRGDGGDRRPV